MSDLNLMQRLNRRQTLQRSQYDERSAMAENIPLRGTNLGFDVERQGYRMQIPGGGVIAAESLSSGAIPTGRSLKIATARGSSKASVDGMPS